MLRLNLITHFNRNDWTLTGLSELVSKAYAKEAADQTHNLCNEL